MACGRRNIAHITGDNSFQAARDRAEGATAALAAAGLTMVADRPYIGSWDESWGRAAAHMLVEAHPEVDGVFCGSDQIARGVLETMRDLGRDVPGSMSVIGFDNWEAITAHSRPRLTSIDMNLSGSASRRPRLFAAIGGKPLPSGIHYQPCRLMIRASTVGEGRRGRLASRGRR